MENSGMKLPIADFHIRWLLEPHALGADVPSTTDSVAWRSLLLPDGMGNAGYEKIDLALGMSVIRAEHRFLPLGLGRLIALGEVEARYPELTFQVQVAHGGRFIHKEQIPAVDLIFDAGNDLFRLTQHTKVTPLLDASSDSDMYSLMIEVSMLKNLVGEDLSMRLLTQIGLVSPPTVLVCPVPLHVSKPLLGCLPTTLSGELRKVFCQAKVLEYLTLLVQYFTQEQSETKPGSQRRKAREVHDYLMHLEGGLPLLSEIALKFGRSARALNEEFIQEYGESIFSFITNQRLEEARLAIMNSDISLKKLAQRLGYSHVNNFSAAFTRKYGYGPSKLRNGRMLK